MPALQSVVTKDSFNKLQSPVSYLRTRYDVLVKTNSFNTHFADRNDPKVVLPFLRGIQLEFCQINQLLLVKSTDKLTDQLSSLGFAPYNNIIKDTNVKFVNYGSQQLTNITERYYNYEFNIELFVVAPQHWNLVTTANIIMSDLKSNNEKCINTFLTVLKSLSSISKV